MNFFACPWGDRLSFGAPGLGAADMLAQTSWLRLSDAYGRELAVSALAEGFTFPVEPGDAVRARIEIGVGLEFGVTSFEARAADRCSSSGSAPATA